MNIVFLIIVCAFIISVLGLATFALFKLSPLSDHSDHYRDPETGRRLFDSPHLD